MDIANKGDAPETVLAGVKGYEISLDRKKMLVSKGDDFYILDSDVKAVRAGATRRRFSKAKMDLSRGRLTLNPRAEFHELFLDAWRLERDYFYDRKHARRGLEGRCAIAICRWWTAWRTATI